MVGGIDNVAYLPGCWFNDKYNAIAIMLEAVVKEQPGVLESIESQAVKVLDQSVYEEY